MNIDYNQHQEVETKMNHARRNLFPQQSRRTKEEQKNWDNIKQPKMTKFYYVLRGKKANTQSMAQQENNNNNNH